jgi:ubiquinol-cytochrome c reductase cytochrome b subunit
MRVLMRKVFPDHWSFMLGEIALWSFVILLLTGTYLALFFTPSQAEVVHHGSYTKLNGITMSQACGSSKGYCRESRSWVPTSPSSCSAGRSRAPRTSRGCTSCTCS